MGDLVRNMKGILERSKTHVNEGGSSMFSFFQKKRGALANSSSGAEMQNYVVLNLLGVWFINIFKNMQSLSIYT